MKYHTPASPQYDLAIIGAGLSGSAVACHICKESAARDRKISCVIFEPRPNLGAGLAFSSASTAHLLNVPASKMSLDENEPNSFVDWLRKNHHPYEPSSYVPRHLYQSYIEDSFKSIIDQTEGVSFTIVPELVVAIHPGQGAYSLETQSGSEFHANKIVLALGNSPEAGENLETQSAFRSPWDSRSIELSAKASSIAIIGTGLSAIDAVLASEQAGFKGQYTLISRHGMLPQPHPVAPKGHADAEQVTAKICAANSLPQMLREFKRGLESGVPWQTLIDNLRPHTQSIWSRLELKDKNRFLRRLRTYWDSHRHRVPADSLAVITKLSSVERLTVQRAEITGASTSQGGVSLHFKRRPLQPSPAYDLVFDCRGLWTDLRRCNSPLLQNLEMSRLGSFDELGLGLRTNAAGELLSEDSEGSSGIFTLGSMRRGQLWESTAVKEIRNQAQQIAKSIVSELDS